MNLPQWVNKKKIVDLLGIDYQKAYHNRLTDLQKHELKAIEKALSKVDRMMFNGEGENV